MNTFIDFFGNVWTLKFEKYNNCVVDLWCSSYSHGLVSFRVETPHNVHLTCIYYYRNLSQCLIFYLLLLSRTDFQIFFSTHFDGTYQQICAYKLMLVWQVRGYVMNVACDAHAVLWTHVHVLSPFSWNEARLMFALAWSLLHW